MYKSATQVKLILATLPGSKNDFFTTLPLFFTLNLA